MANQITDNRTQLADAENITDGIAGTWVGSTSPAQAIEVYIEGAASIGDQFNDTVRTILWDNGSTFSLANSHIYIWVNCGIVGLLETQALGGMAIRFCGPAQTDFFEVYVGGNDNWPTAINGGWVQFAVDVVAAQATPSNTGGTPPAITAIQMIGIAGLTVPMTKVGDNVWVDAIYSLADGVPGIIVEGRNAGTTDWNSADIFTQLGVSAGTFRPGPGGSWVISTPIQFGINDTSTHGFTDTNFIWLWDNQEFVATDLYKISALGNSGGTTNVTFGIKSGSGADATGSQGGIISAASTGVRYDVDMDDPDLDAIGFFGGSFIHGGDFQLDTGQVEVVSTNYIDCTSAFTEGSRQTRIGVVAANTADGVPFMTLSNISGVTNSTFEFSDGHAIELVGPGEPATQFLTDVSFTGYGADGTTDAAIENSTGNVITINVTGASPTVLDTSGTTILVVSPVTTTVTVRDNTGALLQDARVYLEAADGTAALPFEDSVSISVVTTTATVTHTAHGMADGDQVMISGCNQSGYNGAKTITYIDANSYSYTVVNAGAATGTIIATGILLNELTTAGGIADDIRSISTAQPVTGWVRKSSGAPYFKTFPISGTVSTTSGLSINVQMILDQ